MATTKETHPGTLPDLMKQLAELQAKVEKVKEKEKAEVLARVKEAIEVYGITVAELFPNRPGRKAGVNYAKPKAVAAPAVKEKKVKRPKQKRRHFEDAEKKSMLDQHSKLVTSGMTFDAASKKMATSGSVLRKWYAQFKVVIPERKAA